MTLVLTLVLLFTIVDVNLECDEIVEGIFVNADDPKRGKIDETMVLEQAENLVDGMRCPVKLYEFYLSKWYTQCLFHVIKCCE